MLKYTSVSDFLPLSIDDLIERKLYEVSPLRLQQANKRTVGTRQTLKAVERDQAEIVYIADDAEKYILRPLLELCQEKNIPVVTLETMQQLGETCGIEVKAAAAALMKN